MAKTKKVLSAKEEKELLTLLQSRFDKNMKRHPQAKWSDVAKKLEANKDKLWSLQEMENTGGEPDVVAYDKKTDTYTFFDCSAESPKGRRSICFDREALDARKEFKPGNNALDMAAQMGISILDEEQYRYLQQLGHFDAKTSSWIATPDKIRKLGGALFADYRYDTVFVYHNGAQSYYAARGFRGALVV
jgi:hypothetical protein